MNLVNNANQIAAKKLGMDNSVGAYKSAATAMQHGYRHQFASSMQTYVTKIGLILSDCVVSPKISTGTYLGSIDYICKKLLKNIQLYNVMRAIEINDAGNEVKHTIKDVDLNIDFILKQYNSFVTEIVKATGLNAFKKCYLNKERNARDIPLVAEEKHHKYFVVNNTKFQLKISPNYTVDQYSKKLTSKITIYWPEGKANHFIDVQIKNPKNNNRLMGSIDKLDISNPNSKHAFVLNCSEADLDRRVLYLTVNITLYKQNSSTVTTGALFWKETHTQYFFVEVGKSQEQISQLFRA